MKTIRNTCVASVLFTGLMLGLGEGPVLAPVTELYVNPLKGRDRNRGTKASPVKTISAALAKIADPVTESVTIFVLPGDCLTTGGKEMPDTSLLLMRRMRPGVSVIFKGEKDHRPLFGWAKQAPVVLVTEGSWGFQNIKIGGGSLAEGQGIVVEGGAKAKIGDCRFRLRSEVDAAIVARRGGMVELHGAIEINEDLHGTEKLSSFSGILAEDGGVVVFAEGDGARLDIGNGNLRADHYGQIRLDCAEARITSWSKQSNILSAAHGGRIDLRNTTMTLHAHHAKNSAIGLLQDGHLSAVDAKIVIKGENDTAIRLQAASSLACSKIDLRGKFSTSLHARGGAVFVGGFVSKLTKLIASTGASIHIETIAEGKTVGEVTAESGGLVSVAGVLVRSK